jgi:hypothetical protein
LNTGKAPFLLEHRYHLEDMLGSVVEAWVGGGVAQAIVRFADMPSANRVWALLEQGFPIAASAGYQIGATRPVDLEGESGRRFIVDTWKATEISACVAGADQGAHISCRPLPELAALTEQRRARRIERERDECRAALKADTWRKWAANGAADAVAAAAGVTPAKIRSPLIAAVEHHLADLENDL